jgi:dTDP-4-dehydrorhamnose 3,5-epimerase
MIQKKFKALLFKDNRGYLAEITPKEINRKFIYSILTNSKKNVIRGMHYNKKKEEEKLVYVLDGEVLDVTVNLNKGKNFGKINYTKLKKNDILYLPKGFAHGYKCLGKSNTVLYLLTQKYSAKNNHGFIWNDKNFKIKWKIKNPILSNRDKNFKEYIVK